MKEKILRVCQGDCGLLEGAVVVVVKECMYVSYVCMCIVKWVSASYKGTVYFPLFCVFYPY